MKSTNCHNIPASIAGGASRVKPFMLALFSICLLALNSGNAMANSLQDISYSSLSGNAVQVTLQLAEPAAEPMIFTHDFHY